METAPPIPPVVEITDPLVRRLREELIKTQMVVLELNDRILEKETERTDAIAILGRAELVLEQKIDYIVELDAALNTRLRELAARVDQSRLLIEQQAAEIVRICTERDREYAARDAIIQDHARRLDAANQEIGRVHTMAGEYARDLAHTRDALTAESTAHQSAREQLGIANAQLEATSRSLASTQSDLAGTAAALAETRVSLAAATANLTATAEKLGATTNQLAAERRTVALIKNSAFWRLGRPWRALFGPKL